LRILADENLAREIVASLRALGHDVRWVLTDAPGIRDEDVLSRATDEGRLLLTADKDFGEVKFRLGEEAPYGLLLLRVRGSTEFLATVVLDALNAREDWSNVFAVLEADRLRVVQLPAQE
jgi:predicted nuclease of predicted toxin-antitoxin system